MITETLSANIAYYRKQKGMTQTELGKAIGVTDKAVSKWENAYGIPDTECLLLLARCFGVTVDQLISARADENTINSATETTVICKQKEQNKSDGENYAEDKNDAKKHDDGKTDEQIKRERIICDDEKSNKEKSDLGNDESKNDEKKRDGENKKHNFLQSALSPYSVTHNKFTYVLLFAYVLIALLSVICTPLKYVTYDDKAHKLSIFSLIFSADSFTFVEFDHALSTIGVFLVLPLAAAQIISLIISLRCVPWVIDGTVENADKASLALLITSGSAWLYSFALASVYNAIAARNCFIFEPVFIATGILSVLQYAIVNKTILAYFGKVQLSIVTWALALSVLLLSVSGIFIPGKVACDPRIYAFSPCDFVVIAEKGDSAGEIELFYSESCILSTVSLSHKTLNLTYIQKFSDKSFSVVSTRQVKPESFRVGDYYANVFDEFSEVNSGLNEFDFLSNDNDYYVKISDSDYSTANCWLTYSAPVDLYVCKGETHILTDDVSAFSYDLSAGKYYFGIKNYSAIAPEVLFSADGKSDISEPYFSDNAFELTAKIVCSRAPFVPCVFLILAEQADGNVINDVFFRGGEISERVFKDNYPTSGKFPSSAFVDRLY